MYQYWCCAFEFLNDIVTYAINASNRMCEFLLKDYQRFLLLFYACAMKFGTSKNKTWFVQQKFQHLERLQPPLVWLVLLHFQ